MKLIATATICFIFFLIQHSFGQSSGEWRNYVDSSNEIWFQAPASVYIEHNKKEKSVSLYATFEGVYVTVTKRSVERQLLEGIRANGLRFWEKGTKAKKYNSRTFEVTRIDNPSAPETVTIYFWAASKDNYFSVSATARVGNIAMNQFVESIRFGAMRLDSQANVKDLPLKVETVMFDALPSSPEVEAALARPTANTKEPGNFDEIKDILPTEAELNRLSSNVITLRKPRPGYTDSARQNDVQGTIRANVEFLANGTIGSVTVDKNADRGLAKNVVVAARSIVFIPAKVNGTPVDTVRTVRYKFSIY